MKQLLKRPVLALLILLTLLPAAAMLARVSPIAGLKWLSDTHLGGVVEPPPPPPWTLSAFMSGEFQAKAMPWASEAMGRPREVMLRLNNGAGYLMGRSFNPEVSIGRQNVLYPTNYVRDWCGKGRRNKRAVETAASIAKTRDLVEESGRTFVLLFSPTKPGIYPENLSLPCVGGSPERPSGQLRTALAKHNIKIVDGTAVTREAKAREDAPLFGRDGLHWNSFGASFSVTALMSTLEEKLGKPLRKLELANFAINDRPGAVDEDLGNLLNLPFELRPYPSPHAIFRTDLGPASPSILMVGTSFSWQLLDLIGSHRLSDQVKFYYYFSKVAEVRNGESRFSDVSFAAEADLPTTFAATDVVLLEVNEANAYAPYIDQFRRALEKLPRKKLADGVSP